MLLDKIIKTKRYLLRKIKETDSEQIFSLYSEDDVVKYFGIQKFTKIIEVRNMINFLAKEQEQLKRITFGIISKKSNSLIGMCHFHNYNDAYKKAELSFEVCKTKWNQGIMSEILPIFLIFGFDELKLNRIQAIVCKENIASIKLLLNNGFEKEGILRENIYNFIENKFEDTIVFSKINSRKNLI